MNKIFKPKAIILLIIEIIIGGMLFAIGDYNDSPGLCVIGLSVGFVLIMLGIYTTGLIKKGLLISLLLLFFSVFITLITLVILLDGEFDDKPWYSIFGFVVGIILLVIGLLRLGIYFNSKS
jgi:hypothetical protein